MRPPTSRYSNVNPRLLVVAALLSWSVSLVLYRMLWGTTWNGAGLLWNLLLAAIPLLWSSAFVRAVARKHWFWAVISFTLWLLFLPNAPYLLSDLIHLRAVPPVPEWYVLAMLLSCAATGTLLGYISLLEVQGAIERRFGSVAGWLLAFSSLLLCGFGIYLGRFLRWNSWDALTRPLQFARTIVGQFVDAGRSSAPIAGHADFRRRSGHRLRRPARFDDAYRTRIVIAGNCFCRSGNRAQFAGENDGVALFWHRLVSP